MLVMIWAVGVTLAVMMEAREGELPRAGRRLLLPSRRLAGSALEERSFTARKTVSQEVQQVSIFFNFIL